MNQKEVDNNAPIRIIKKVKGHGGHHGGAWKVAYADFVTAMMALFIVLWIVGQNKDVKEAIAVYFKDPGYFFKRTEGKMVIKGLISNADNTLQVETENEEKVEMEKVAASILKDLAKKVSMEDLVKQISIQFMNQGMKIEMKESEQSIFFDIGTATLKPDAEAVLKTIATEIAKLTNHIVIEGHTDSRQYTRQDGYTNFELSADRANAARRILIKSGVNEKQIDQVVGCADTKLKNIDDPFDAANRRISILIMYIEKMEMSPDGNKEIKPAAKPAKSSHH
jgi:chemotaxis protein MotB